MAYQAVALDPELFRSWFALSDEVLKRRGARRRVADAPSGYPCRVSLQDAATGEELLLLHYEHHAVDTPYRAAGPIYVRAAAQPWAPAIDQLPPMLRSRLLSLRAYSARGMLVDAAAVQGDAAHERIAMMLGDARVGYVHAHFAQPGCYACRFERA